MAGADLKRGVTGSWIGKKASAGRQNAQLNGSATMVARAMHYNHGFVTEDEDVLHHQIILLRPIYNMIHVFQSRKQTRPTNSLHALLQGSALLNSFLRPMPRATDPKHTCAVKSHELFTRRHQTV